LPEQRLQCRQRAGKACFGRLFLHRQPLVNKPVAEAVGSRWCFFTQQGKTNADPTI
jgi:hypothetical protein